MLGTDAPRRGPLIDLRAAEDRIAMLAERYSLPVDPRAAIWQLSVGEQQRVEILKIQEIRGSSAFTAIRSA